MYQYNDKAKNEYRRKNFMKDTEHGNILYFKHDTRN